MEQLVIQSDANYQMAADNFIRAICEGNNIDNYYATISVPVLNTVELAVAQSSQVVLSYGYSVNGITFTVASSSPFLNPASQNHLSGSDLSDSSILLLGMLTDEYDISEDGCKASLVFHIRGIDSREAHRRVSVLQHFYDTYPTLVKVN